MKLGFADWDIDLSLREALIKSGKLENVADLISKYDNTFDFSQKENVQIHDKYKHIYKLINR